MGRTRRRLALVVAVLARAGAAHAQPAPAAPPALTLTWRAPALCPTGADVEARFRHLVGATTKHVDATAEVATTLDGAWSLELQTVLDGMPGRRTLKGDSCAAVAEAASLILAMMIDPLAAERANEPPPPPPPPPPVAPPAIAVAASPPEPWLRPHARAFGGVLFRGLPETTPVAGLALGATHRRARVELVGLASGETRANAATSGVGGTFRLLAAGLRACGRLGGPTLFVEPCLGAELERLAATGFGLPTVSSRVITVGAATAGVDLALPVARHLSLSLGLQAAARPYRPTFFLEGVGDLWRVPAFGALGTLGIIVII